MGEIVTFEDVWDGTVPPPADVEEALPTIDAADHNDTQVVVRPAPTTAEEEDASVSLDTLADKPWVESVVTCRSVTAGRPLPHIRSLYDFSHARTDGVTEATLRNLPNLETLTTPTTPTSTGPSTSARRTSPPSI